MTSRYHRITGWGEALLLEVHLHGGLNPYVEMIRAAVGTDVGVRNSFAKLYKSVEPPTARDDRWRAWLLLTALGENPAEWGISDEVVPPAIDTERLSDLLIRQSRCIAA